MYVCMCYIICNIQRVIYNMYYIIHKTIIHNIGTPPSSSSSSQMRVNISWKQQENEDAIQRLINKQKELEEIKNRHVATKQINMKKQ